MTVVPTVRRFALYSLVVLGIPALATAQTPAEKVLPPTTLGFLKVKQAKDLREAVASTQIGRLLADPALKPLMEDIEAKLEGPNAQVEESLGMSLLDVLKLPQGEVSLAVIPTPGQTRPVAIYAAADAGDKVEPMDAFMEKATALATKQGAKSSEQQVGGLTLHVLETANAGAPVAWTKNGSVYHYATNVDVLKDIVQNASGRSDSLAGNEAYQKIVAKVGADAQVVWFVDFVQAGKVGMAVLQQQDQGNAMVLQNQIQLTGLDAIKALGGGVAFNVGPYDQFAQTLLYAPGEMRGILPIFKMPKVDLTPQPWVPTTAASYQSLSWDLDAAYEAIKSFIDTNVGQGMLDGIEQQIAGPQGDGLRFQRDLFGPLGDRITIISDYATPGDETSQRFLFAIALEDQEAFRKTLDKIKTLANAQLPERKFGGTTIYEIEVPAMPGPGGANVQVDGPLSLAIARDHLFVGAPASLVEQVIQAEGPSLLQAPGYQAVAAEYPKAASTLSYTRSEEQARVLYNLIKSGQLSEAMRQAAQNAGGDIDIPDETLIDPAKLPEFSVFAKYIAPGGGFGVMDSDGVTFTQFVLKKEAP